MLADLNVCAIHPKLETEPAHTTTQRANATINVTHDDFTSKGKKHSINAIIGAVITKVDTISRLIKLLTHRKDWELIERCLGACAIRGRHYGDIKAQSFLRQMTTLGVFANIGTAFCAHIYCLCCLT